MELKLREYQENDVRFSVKRKRVYLTHEPGLGKTVIALETCSRLGYNNILVLGPKLSMGVWRDEAAKFYGWDSIIVDGTATFRKKCYKHFLLTKPKLMVTNPSLPKLKEILDLDVSWDAIIIDEIQAIGLLNHRSQTFKLVKKLNSDALILMSGTPVRRGPQDLFAPLHLLNPVKFKSYWPFVNTHCLVLDNGFGKDIMGKPKNPIQFNNMLKYYAIRRKKEEVLDDLPDKIRSCVPIKMNKLQARSYYEMEKTMMLDTGDDFLLSANPMMNTLRLRQLIICPKILGVDDYGASIEALGDELLPMDFEAGRSVLIATPFRAAIPFIKEYLYKNIPDIHIEVIQGDSKELVADIAKRYQNLKTHKKVIIFTIQTGSSWTATDASVCYFLGASWSCADNLQAEGRCHRIGQKNTVEVRYLCCDNTVDDAVKDRLNSKHMAENWILNPVEVMNKIKNRR